MQTTAGEIVRDALTELTVQSNERTVPNIELSTGIRYLNRMMASFDASGIKLGYTVVSSPNDLVTVHAGAIEGMVFNLAVRLANGYDMPIGSALATSASLSMKVLYRLGVRIGKTSFPSTLPLGSGNGDSNGADAEFYGGSCEDGDSVSHARSGSCGGSGTASGPSIIQSPVAPANPTIGTLWLDTSTVLNGID